MFIMFVPGSCHLHEEMASASCAWFHSWRWLKYICRNCTPAAPAVQGFVFCVRTHSPDNLQSFGAFALYFVRPPYIQNKNNAYMKHIFPSQWKEVRSAHWTACVYFSSQLSSSELFWAIQDTFAASITTSVSVTPSLFPLEISRAVAIQYRG
jgi:hypothetical protein